MTHAKAFKITLLVAALILTLVLSQAASAA